MSRQRDYKAEYARRIQRGLDRGLSRSQARGHPRPIESHVSARASTPRYDRRLEEGVKALREGKPLRAAARSARVSEERMRSYVAQTGVVQKERGRWRVQQDTRERMVPIYTDGRVREIRVPDYDSAYLVSGAKWGIGGSAAYSLRSC